ncbi:MAG TPA: beta-L-arabinofuranosidase domain-containing protein [Bryobacteraceae bacterium]|jgi:hypothetical protein|nr:beta-L-arabinofuranosidase domain-containing protein [Bryobacteraceae bacterium]
MKLLAIAACFVPVMFPASGAEPAQNDWKQQGVIYLDQSLNARLHPAPVQAVHLSDGFWAERRRVTTQRSLPTMLELLEDHGTVDNFRRLSGKKNVPRRGPLYTDSDLYKWMEAASWALASNETSDADKAKLRAKLTPLIADVIAAQEPSGYLNTYFVGDKERLRFADLTKSHEGYCLGHLLQAGIAYYRATGSRALLDPGIKFADYIVENFGPTKRPFITGHPELEMSLVELYRVTRDARYLDFVRYLFSGIERDRLKLKDADVRYMFSGRPFTSRTEFEGHAVRALYASSGATDYLMEGGDVAFKRTLDLLWNDLTMRKMYITGGVGARAGGESFGDPYELPNLEAYAETCAAIANVMWNFRMLALTGEAQYADVLERALYNGVNSGLSLAGTLYCYRNPLATNGAEKLRNPWYDTDCCPPNIERLFESLPGYFYATGRDGLYVTLYHNSSLEWHLENGVALNLTQSTTYPWSGEIKFTVQPARPVDFTLNLRWPGWSPSAEVTVNGQSVRAATGKPGSYIALHREWKAGDTVSLSLAMPITPMLANPHVLEDFGRVAFQRGPIVYALEQMDQGGASLTDMSVRTNGALMAEPRRELLGGVVVLKISGQTSERSSNNGQDPLYAPLGATTERAKRPILLTFVPFYAVQNREPNPMEVWVPVIRGEGASAAAALTGVADRR